MNWIEALQKLLPALSGLPLVPKLVVSVISVLIIVLFLLLIWSPPRRGENEVGSISTTLTVWSEVDVEVYVDNAFLMKIDNSTGFDYVRKPIRVRPSSPIMIKAPGFEITRAISDVCDLEGDECKVRVGTDRLSDISITNEQKRAAMGSGEDIPGITERLRIDPASSVRANAAERLGYIGGEEAVTALKRALRDPDDYVKAKAAEALGRLQDPSLIPIIQEAYDKYERKERYGYIFEKALKDLRFVAQRDDTKTGR